MSPKNINVIGTLNNPLHALNLKETLDSIAHKYQKTLIITVYACLGRVRSIGEIRVLNGPIKLGIAMKKDLQWVGDINVTGVVNVSDFMEF